MEDRTGLDWIQQHQQQQPHTQSAITTTTYMHDTQNVTAVTFYIFCITDWTLFFFGSFTHTLSIYRHSLEICFSFFVSFLSLASIFFFLFLHLLIPFYYSSSPLNFVFEIGVVHFTLFFFLPLLFCCCFFFFFYLA